MQQVGRFAEAEEHFRAALRCDPNFVLAHVSLADTYSSRGEAQRAEEAARTALALDPSSPEALSQLASTLGKKLPDADLQKIEKRLEDPNLPIESRFKLLYPLANIYDFRGDYARAADCARQANALRMAVFKDQNLVDDLDDDERMVDWCIQNLNQDFFARLAGAGSPSRRPVFVFGMPRSGTSLVEQILASHSSVFGAGELRLAHDLCRPAIQAASATPEGVRRLDARVMTLLGERFLKELDAYDGGRNARIVDKMPGNFKFLGLLAVMFPNASFVHCRRDLRDVAVSCWMNWFGAFTWADDTSSLSRFIKQYVRLMDHWRRVLPGKFYELEYEPLVGDFEPNARKLIAACGLEWEEHCLDFHRTERTVRTDRFAQVRKPVSSRSVGRWKHYELYLADLFSQIPGSSLEESHP